MVEQTENQVIQVLDEFSRLFIQQEVEQMLSCEQRLTLFTDLSGRPVSDRNKTYPEAS